MHHASYSRREFLGALAALGGLVAVGCSSGNRRAGTPGVPATEEPSQPAQLAQAAVTPTPTPAPPPPAGATTRALLEGTASETELVVTHSGVAGPTVLVLGGVHGNEPGGWMAAEDIATWQPAAGSLLVIPRANVLAIRDFVRTTDDLGDLNRLYPGDASSDYPMARMAHEVVSLAREHAVSVVLDLHESWAFFAERTQNGTAFLGQTVTAGVGPRNPALAGRIVEAVNAELGEGRDLLVQRDGSPFRRSDSASTGASRGRSSLSLGGHVEGLTPILIEMGQEGQPIERRVELHRRAVRAALAELGMA